MAGVDDEAQHQVEQGPGHEDQQPLPGGPLVEEPLLRDVLDHFTDLPTNLDVHERVARSVACQGAVKAGQKLSLSEMNALIDQLFATELPYSCPHGRPTFMRMTLAELDKRFGRT
mgnify:CR=1 FL=1